MTHDTQPETTRDLERDMEKHLGPGAPGDDPWAESFDPDGDATALCRHCWFPIAQRRIRTSNMFKEPFWRTAWVHAYGGDECCSAPIATPDIFPVGGDDE